MFSDWTDPNDIDNYYDETIDLYEQVKAAPSSNEYQQLPFNVPNSSKANAFTLQNGLVLNDGHSVGSQPAYNVLQSGPPAPAKKEKYVSFSPTTDGYGEAIAVSGCNDSYDTMTLFLCFVIGVFFCMYISASRRIEKLESILFLTLIDKKYNNPIHMNTNTDDSKVITT